ncbi:MAG: TerC family protein [Hyphomicrobiales bacterium]
MVEFLSPAWWAGLVQIIGIDIVLSGDNALVIALACRSLPENQRKWGIILGAGAAIALRVIFAVGIVYLLEVPFLKFAGSLLLIWIAVKLVMPEDHAATTHEADHPAATNLWSAVRIVMVADAVMSLDNVLAVAAAAKGSVELLVIGIAISIPLIVAGSAMMLWLLDRFPLLVIAGSALLGWIAGELAIHDPIAGVWMAQTIPWLHASLPYIACGAMVVIGLYVRRDRRGWA